jgi:hypothetical protein
MISVELDTLQAILDRYNTSDEFDTLEYCVNDLLPETRGDDEYTNKVAHMVLQLKEVSE